MKCLYWNVRGLANSPTRLALKRLVINNSPDIIIIAEPWMKFQSFLAFWLDRLNLKLFAMNNRGHLDPNLWCICRKDLNPNILSFDDQHVSFSVMDNNTDMCIAAVYGSTCYLKRRQLWLSLSNLQIQFPNPWCFFGDFNSILGAHEHKGFCIPARIPIDDFNDWTDSNNLIHLPTRGAFYTWSNRRSGNRHTERRLDRSICNQAWLDVCTSIVCSTLVKTRSDHYPLLLDYCQHNKRFVSSFKFMKMWSMHEDCKNVISQCWNDNAEVGCPMFVLNSKLKRLKTKLKIWNKESFGNVHSGVKDAESHLHSIQLLIQTNGHSDSLMMLEKKAQMDLDTALDRQDCFWREKAKVNWHLDGDRNTSYFHRIAKIKNTTKVISSLKNGDDIITDPTQIADHVVDYYKNLFCSNPILQDQLLVEHVIPNLVGQDVNALLTMTPSKEEIKHAVFDLNKDGAPGPDGFGAHFYQTYWDIIHHDVTNAVLQFFTTGWILPNYNSNTIILIPKSDSADSIEKYRPIALANFKFKIISKVLADRLAQILPTIVSKEQKGFIQGRNIKDCICTASEAINLLHNKTFGGNLAMKIDITKAFDTLDWSFLIKVLLQFGFNTTFCNWIKAILSSATMSVSLNGAQKGFFKCLRGVRQGDPLSPLLFCLAEEVLSRGISLLVDEGKIELIKGSRNTRVPSHCLYADDIMVFCKGKFSSLQALQNLFNKYANCSGQVINASKSTIFAGGISQVRLNHIVNLIGFNVGSLPFNYLGVPIFKGKPKASFFLSHC
jgi:hypothetical protein